jgi:membrane-associated protease RseP (regulator of RpoE activity)
VFVLGVLVVLVGVLLSIALHEVGHLVPAKKFGIKVTQYMVGFGPTLWSRRRGDTEYGLKAIPLGGYVRMIGMFPPVANASRRRPGTTSVLATIVDDARSASGAEVAPGEEHRAFYSQSVPKRLVVMLAGPTMNLLIAVVLIAVVLMGFGVPRLTSTLGSVTTCVTPFGEPERACTAADPVAPGSAAGLQTGDTVLSWGGQPVADWDELSTLIRAGGTGTADVVVERDGQELALQVNPVVTDRPAIVDGAVVLDDAGEPVLEPTPYVGIGPSLGQVRQPASAVPGVVGEMVGQTVGVVLSLPQRMVAVVGAAFGDGERDPSGVVGLVGVGRFAGEIASVDADQYSVASRIADLLALLAALNVALFVFNLVPLVPLDGGHVAGALWEGLRRRIAQLSRRPDPGPVDVAKAMPLAYAVVVLMLGMGLVLAYADIVRPITLTG